METCEAADALGNQNFKVLLAFSLSRVDDQAAMDALELYLNDSNFRLFIPDNFEILSEKRSE